jgi:threonine/homoserine/homoserine lactone efflux protein
VSASRLLAFALFSLILIVIPGPNVLFVISRSLLLGRKAGVVTAMGGQIGIYAQVAGVAFGLGVLIERSVALFTVLKLVGGCYLAYLGVQAIRHRRSLGAQTQAQIERKTMARILRDGAVVGVSNPKTIVFFAAVLPQFVSRSAGNIAGQMLLLGVVNVAIAMVSDSSYALVAGTARAWFARSPRRLERIGGISGLVMIGLGTSLALTARTD